MSGILEALNELCDRLQSLNTPPESLQKLVDSAGIIAKSWSGSWIGYQSRVYYRDFREPPANEHFNIEFGMHRSYYQNDMGDWCEYTPDQVINEICKHSKIDNIIKEEQDCAKIVEAISSAKVELRSILSSYKQQKQDELLTELLTKINKIKCVSESDIINVLMPKGQLFTRDKIALSQGLIPPPHICMYSKAKHLLNHYTTIGELVKDIKQIINHMKRNGNAKLSNLYGERIFIGHGHALEWMKLKDFLHQKLHLDYDEFNRIPIAGVSNINRLADMLDNAKFAFLVMTAEDDHNGLVQARMNVIHEVGLFQGRLGFDKAIVLLEEGCQEFSNIQGLGQIRFQKNKISSCFEEIRETLKYHGII